MSASRAKDHPSIALSEPLLDINDVCALLRVQPATVYGWRYRGEGPEAIPVGNKLRWDREEVIQWLESNRPAPAPSTDKYRRSGPPRATDEDVPSRSATRRRARAGSANRGRS